MAEKKELKSLGYEIFIGVLSILSIVNHCFGFSDTRSGSHRNPEYHELAVQYHFHY